MGDRIVSSQKLDPETLNSIEYLRFRVATDSRDWAQDASSAWIYGIIIGWDIPALAELSIKFGWKEKQWETLIALHEDFDKRSK